MNKREFMTGFGMILFCIVLIVATLFNPQAKKQRIESWTAKNNYEIVEIESVSNSGPFAYKENGQTVFRARVKDSNNRQKWIWFRIGLFTDVKER